MSDISQVANLLPTVNEGFTTTLATTITAGADTVPLNGVTDLVNASVFVGIIDIGTDKQQAFTGTVDTGTSRIIGVKWTRGSNVPHTAGATIVDYVSGTVINMLSKAMQVQHKQNGAHGNITADSITTTGDANFGGNISLTGTLASSHLTNPYKFNVFRNGSATYSPGTAAINYDTEEFDTGSNVLDGTFTAPVAGFYLITGMVTATLGSGANCATLLYKNGSTYKQLDEATAGPASGNVSLGGTTLVQLAANDTLQIFFFNGTAGNINLVPGNAFTYFQGHIVSVS